MHVEAGSDLNDQLDAGMPRSCAFTLLLVLILNDQPDAGMPRGGAFTLKPALI